MPTSGDYQPALAAAMRRSVEEHRRAALVLLAPELWSAEREATLGGLGRADPERLFLALASDQVDQLFLQAAGTAGLDDTLPAPLVARLTERRMAVAVDVIRQEHLAGEVRAVLDEAGVEHVVIKGALVRQFLYAKPYHRPSADVDVVVPRRAMGRVTRLLEQRGYTLTVAAHSDTHEVWLQKLGAGVDLHWTLMRPGRMRREITHDLLSSRVLRGALWGPSDPYLTVMMLVHPAITDHVTARLVSAVDLDRWLRQGSPPWEQIVGILDRIGLRTAAWTMLLWTHGLLGTPVPPEIWRALDPGRLRKRYLEAWLKRHPARLYARRPNVVRALFSLALQDQARGAARAVWRMAKKPRINLSR